MLSARPALALRLGPPAADLVRAGDRRSARRREAEVEIADEDLRVDTYRASGAGRQHVNKTDSAVRITHLPTGIVIQYQNERSQSSTSRRRCGCCARVSPSSPRKARGRAAKERGEAQNTGFESQIHGFVLHPYQMVKDKYRTNFEVGNTDGVLDGDLDSFIQAYLLAKAARRLSQLGC